MMFKALIADLDNTVYPVRSIGDRLFVPLVDLMEQYRNEMSEEQIQQVKAEIMGKAFQQVADKHQLNPELKARGIKLLENLTYDLPMQPYNDYHYMQEVEAEKFLVTLGFTKLQWSKIDRLNLRGDFKELIVVDPETIRETKQDIFKQLSDKYNFKPEEVLVVGDDPDSEIKAGKALGMATYLRDEQGSYPAGTATYQYSTLAHLAALFK